jgi:GTPase
VYREFVAEVLILSHATTIKTKYQAMLHVGPVSQTCAIIDIDRQYIRTGDRAQVRIFGYEVGESPLRNSLTLSSTLD